MSLLIGFVLALAVFLFARGVGLDRDRAFYPTVLIVVASYYGLFAIMGGTRHDLLHEAVVVAAFALLAVLGFKLNPWLVVLGLFAHGVFDFFHAHLISNPGVPVWWPMFCLSYDVTAAAGLAWLLLRPPAARKSA
jgi:hypothetical protein